ncbi:arsenical pump-driving ATPase [Salisediminibacterium halotolerans]|uniref:arsenical pump-driving ATPase n=1 Tax=Salisediminibacterium halotolerans TaxID=517425 RepID=UPI000EB11B96|nr:arsenical pump-driving ATPase [Salisediminibacterium halotolerans]RLJ78303.1 arsenite efflux ATP-binding protein ArsA [Actinophytocola xinjiangensis]RPE88358.1 arsenite efflux ATP-binding protein ArsA [Salisediminibacterium halotolerans]TWG37279.1 arsenite efflux ATP-binding protein ArsA [Salisediminibacterium halotolerans]GEL08330.1 arsenical pump-driving ATPase [Salisediminibacterium halotolerans]
MKQLTPNDLATTKHLFFTGKGGVGKTSTACAAAVSLAEAGKKVLIVSTDPASNLQDVFGMELANKPAPIESVPNLYAANLDPEEAAAAYREKMVGPYRDKLPQAAITSMEEQLSGACTVEIAAFDEFSNLLADGETTASFDHILFDTAPTGHTLRLLQLPTAWNDFLENNENGASCLGPLAGLEDKKALYAKTVEALADGEATKLILVARPDPSSLQEAANAGGELQELGIDNQMLVVNGLFQRSSADTVALRLEAKQQEAVNNMPGSFENVPVYQLPLVPYNLTGLDALRRLFDADPVYSEEIPAGKAVEGVPSVGALVDDLSGRGEGVCMTMGKGGVGKTTMAAAVAVGLAEKGHRVHLTTTDPAAHLTYVLRDEDLNGSLEVSRIDPKQVTEAYKQHVLSQVTDDLSEDELAYIKEDLESPCTEEIAVFHAFADVFDQADGSFVVIDTAPTGHTLLLLDNAESYHREVERTQGDMPEAVKRLLPRLRDPEQTFVALVTLPEATPVFEAGRLADDLRRAGIEPAWWLINQSFQAAGTTDRVLAGRAAAEEEWITSVLAASPKTAVIPWQADDVIGLKKLKEMTV